MVMGPGLTNLKSIPTPGVGLDFKLVSPETVSPLSDQPATFCAANRSTMPHPCDRLPPSSEGGELLSLEFAKV